MFEVTAKTNRIPTRSVQTFPAAQIMTSVAVEGAGLIPARLFDWGCWIVSVVA